MQAVSRVLTSADGYHLYAEAAGNRDNPALLFIHGISASSDWWRKQFDSLSNQFYCVRFDLRGHGASEKPSDAAAYRESKRWADDVATVIAAFELNKPAVCVWSYGGLVLGDYLRHYGQEKLSRLIIMDTTLQFNAGRSEEFIARVCIEIVGKLLSPDVITYREGVEATTKLLTLRSIEPRDAAHFLGIGYLTAPSTWQAMFDRTIDNVDVFQAVSLPTLIVYGEYDQVFTSFATEQLAEVISHAHVSRYPCGHAPFYECAERFNMELVQFLSQ